jgi:pimeloyl-ACP methyl ester carboxylesterase
LGEIEARLLDIDGVREAVVVAREDTPGDKRLVAYYTAEAGVKAEHLRPALLSTLPDYMVPAAYVRLESLPLTPNGKLDRKALPAPEGNAYATRAYEAPVGPVEEALARIWAELLGVEQVGRHDSFFELGGHSLLAVRMISRVREQLDTEVALPELFAHPGLGAFAARLSDGANQTTLTDHVNAVTQTSNHNVRASSAFSVPSRIAKAPSEEVNHLCQTGKSHCEIAYQIHRKKNLDVIYVHGHGEASYVWHPILELVDHNYGAITLDLRGHGESQWSINRKYSDETFADDIASVVRTSGTSDHVVVGHSLGAAAALAYAARHPSTLCGVVLVDYGSENDAPADLSKEPAEKPLYDSIEQYYNFLKAARPLGVPSILQHYAERAIIATRGGFITKEDPCLQNLYIGNSALTAITLVNTPMLIIRGQYSSHLSKRQIDSMRKVHGASVCEISNCGHAIMSENPSALAAQISQFLNALDVEGLRNGPPPQ